MGKAAKPTKRPRAAWGKEIEGILDDLDKVQLPDHICTTQDLLDSIADEPQVEPARPRGPVPTRMRKAAEPDPRKRRNSKG